MTRLIDNLPLLSGLAIASLIIAFEHIYQRAISRSWFVKRRRIEVLFKLTYAAITMIFASTVFLIGIIGPFFALAVQPNLFLKISSNDSLISIFISFVVITFSWHIFFLTLPCVIMFSCWLILRQASSENFPKLIDYSYVMMGVVGLAFAIVEIYWPESDPVLYKAAFLNFLIVAASLRTTKITMEIYKKKYLPDDVWVRSPFGSTILPILR